MNINKNIKKVLGNKSKVNFNIDNKINNLASLAKDSVFFPFTSPTVKYPTGKIIKGNMPGIKKVIKNFGLKQYGGKKDWDGDGIPNRKDCQPRNIMRQDWDLESAKKKGHNIKYMSPTEYLKKTEGLQTPESQRKFLDKGYYDIESKKIRHIHELGEYIKSKNKRVDVPYLDIESSGFGLREHSGRHRAYAAEKIGEKKIPVLTSNVYLRTQKGNEDTDGDGVINVIDCKPQNKDKQDFALDKERYNFEQQRLAYPKYGRKIVMIPTEELYHKRAKYNIQDTEYLYEDSYRKMKNAKEEYMKEKKIPQEEKYLISDDDIMKFRYEKRKKVLELQGYKVYPPKIIKRDYGAIDKYKIKYRNTPKKYDERVEEIMSPQNWGDNSSKRFNDLTKSGIPKEKAGQIVRDEYYNKMKKDVESKKPIVPMVSLYGDDVPKSKTMGEGRHRILSAKAAGMKEMPVFIEPNKRLPEGALDKYRELSNEEIKKYVPTKKENTKEINNLMNDDDNDGVNNLMDCDPNNKFKQGPGDYDITSIMQKYEQNPRGDWQGQCHNAVQELARYFQNNGVEPNRMKVYQIQTVGRDGMPSNHVILQVDDTFYDPTGMQYTYLHNGNYQTIRTSLPPYYNIYSVIPVYQYL